MIRDIYTKIAETAIGTVQARDLDEIKLTVRAADCPMRLLLPSTQGSQGFVAIGTLSNTHWFVRDLCLWQPIIEGTGIEQCANDMLAYIELYAAAIRAMRNPTPQSNIVNVEYQLGPVAWANIDFWAIDISLEIEEILQ